MATKLKRMSYVLTAATSPTLPYREVIVTTQMPVVARDGIRTTGVATSGYIPPNGKRVRQLALERLTLVIHHQTIVMEAQILNLQA
jgi:hypothetical protein